MKLTMDNGKQVEILVDGVEPTQDELWEITSLIEGAIEEMGTQEIEKS